MAGRHKGYDEAAVLTAAMHAFRRRGYEGVSIRSLEDATGLKAGSIYNSFRDKAGLFVAAFAHYNFTVLQRRIDQFAPARAGLQGLRALFLSLLAEPGGGAFGCLITNSAIELGQQGLAKSLIDEGLETLRTTFAARLSAASRAGGLRYFVDPDAAAAHLLALYQGILVLVRSGAPRTMMKSAIDAAFTTLEKDQ